MNIAEAKRVLIACRPGSDDLRSGEAAAALELAQREPELRQWWEQQQAFHRQTQNSLRDLPVPSHLRERILSRAKVIEMPWWQRRVIWSAAAAVLILLAAIAIWQQQPKEDSFATFRSRVVRAVLRQYRMDIMTNDMGQIRRFLDAHEAPADYTLPPVLARMPAMGAGVLSWRDRKVSMVCLDAGEQGTAFLFVVDRASVGKAPVQREFAAVNELNTVSWSEGSRSYVLASPAPKQWLEQLP